jgi:two-component system CheB/CheR fusion protein
MLLIAVTGYGGPRSDKALSAGFDHHLVKPVDDEALAALLAQGQTTMICREM